VETFKHIVNTLADPRIYFILGVLGFFAMIFWMRQLTHPMVAIVALVVLVVFYAIGLQDENFRAIVGKPDNIPISMLFLLVGFFTWLSLRKAVANDRLKAEGAPTFEDTEAKGRTYAWPDLVYTEFICLILITVFLAAWSVTFEAPIEQPASTTKSPNPSKAPWYFLGLQEMLVYFDPWLAGVVLPSFIILGLMALPYIDPNPKGNGYYTFKERPFAIGLFLFGFLVLWVSLIVLGTFLRGPNWNFFGPFEPWDVHKLLPLTNVNLSEYIWVRFLHRAMPDHWFVRESFGILAVILYLALPPLILAKTVFRKLFVQMGLVRYSVMILLFLTMMSLPIKMLLRWTLNLKYIVAIHEHFFNI